MNLYQLIRPLIFKLEPETAHNLAIKYLQYFPHFATQFSYQKNYKNLANKLWNIDFTNPIGLSGGFDKNAEILFPLSKFGFGFIECGTTTPLPQIGNNKPRIFRLEPEKAIINRLGFNNLGSEVFLKNINNFYKKNNNKVPTIGINIGKNKDSQDNIADYIFLLEKFFNYCNYLTVNISSPNTVNLRSLQKKEELQKLIDALIEKRETLSTKYQKKLPILFKIAPDLTLEEQEDIAKIALENNLDGLIISNTTTSRLNITKPHKLNIQDFENGGLSGAPLFDKSTMILRNFYQLTKGKIPLIGVGGVSNAKQAYQKIRCGASLVQIYTAFIYEGFSLVEQIKEELNQLLIADGFNNIKDVIGVDVKENN